jgi:3-phenylpropionate/cinnamic acid dioxygenase small subunit
MSTLSVEVSPEQQRRLERFYFHEARLLDNRQYLQWLTLLSEDVRYIIPSRVNVQVNNRARGQEDMISVEHELEGEDSMGCPHREEGYMLLMLRAERAYKINSWSENPPARTRRIVGNIELMAQGTDTLSVLSNFYLYYARPGSDNILYSGQRRDTLLSQTDGFCIVRREVVLDYAAIELPTLGLFF